MASTCTGFLENPVQVDATGFPEQRKLLTVAFSPTTGGAIHGQFDVIVGRRGALGVTPEVD